MSSDQDAGTDELGDQKAPVGPSDAEVEAQIRTEFGPQLLATTGLHRFGESSLYNWVGRSVDADSVDAVILGEAARATKTLGGVARLAAGGYGQQGAMLVRSLFEGMATAHWAHAHPTEAIDLLARHSRHSAALWREALANADPDVELPPDQVSPEERDDLDALFGRYGTKL